MRDQEKGNVSGARGVNRICENLVKDRLWKMCCVVRCVELGRRAGRWDQGRKAEAERNVGVEVRRRWVCDQGLGW